MKTSLLLLLVLFLSVSAFGQSALEPSDSSWLFPRVIKEHKLTKDVAFDAMVLQLAKVCNKANEIVQLKDKESGTIVVKPTFTVRFGLFDAVESEPMHYTLTITIKDNKVRYVIETNLSDIPSDYLEEEITEYYNNTIASLQSGLDDYVIDDDF